MATKRGTNTHTHTHTHILALDPSYEQQLLCLTYPMIGNYGVPSSAEVDEHGIPLYFESRKIFAAALIVNDLSEEYRCAKEEG